MTTFSTIGLIGHLNNERAVYTIKRLIRYLQQRNLAYVLEAETGALIRDVEMIKSAQRIADMDALGQVCDLVIVVGGDGSLLRGARALAKYPVPLLGVNRGRLGFLTDITPEDIERKVADVLAGHYTSEKRFLLDMEVRRGDNIIAESDALNDVVLHPGKFIHMLQFEIWVDGVFVTSQRSDGVIVATPTGSTAYSLSGGGPILHPTLDAIVVVPMNPHTLSSRPIVVGGNSEILLLVGEHNRAEPMVTCDGHSHAELQTGDQIIIRKKPDLLELLHPLDYNFYERCRSKLGWGGHHIKE
jgi:NAD+ kinase